MEKSYGPCAAEIFWLVFFQVFSGEGGDGFDEGLFGFGEGADEVAFDIEFGGEFVSDEDGHDDFGFHQGRSGEIADIAGDVIDDYGFAGAGGGSAEAGIERDSRVGGEAADERSDQQDAGIGGIDEIESDPVVACDFCGGCGRCAP